jgi:hypothetical protein
VIKSFHFNCVINAHCISSSLFSFRDDDFAIIIITDNMNFRTDCGMKAVTNFKRECDGSVNIV